MSKDDKYYRNTLNGESWKPTPPKYLYQNVMWSADSTPERSSAHASSIIVGPFKDGKQTLFSTFFWGPSEGNLRTGNGLIKITYNPKDVLRWFKEHQHYPENPDDFDPFNHNTNPLFQYEGPFLIADSPDRAHGNSSLYWDNETGRFHLWVTTWYPKKKLNTLDHESRQKEIDRRVFYKYSDDPEPWTDLNKWSNPVEWSDCIGLWVRGPLRILSDGTWLLPHNDEATWMNEYDNAWTCRFSISKDKGKNWTFSKRYGIKTLPGNTRGGMIQPCAIQLSDGSLYCIARSHRGYIVNMRSQPGGKLGLDWTTPKDSDVPNNNSGLCQIRVRVDANSPDHLLMIYNPKKWGRWPLSIAESLDGGQTWSCLFDLRDEQGELSYPWMVQTSDGLIHCSYTLHRLVIAHDVFII